MSAEAHDAHTEHAEQEQVLGLKEQMSTLNAVIASLKGRADSMAQRLVADAQDELARLRVQVTQSKPLHLQVQTFMHKHLPASVQIKQLQLF